MRQITTRPSFSLTLHASTTPILSPCRQSVRCVKEGHQGRQGQCCDWCGSWCPARNEGQYSHTSLSFFFVEKFFHHDNTNVFLILSICAAHGCWGRCVVCTCTTDAHFSCFHRTCLAHRPRRTASDRGDCGQGMCSDDRIRAHSLSHSLIYSLAHLKQTLASSQPLTP